ncbi:MAG: KamA family radical SAM protein, partial [Bacteroidales bacterium]|nr:KamA family radical SAM protein [Bacteroidales bacterium]
PYTLHQVEKNQAKECIRVLKNIIRTENEDLTGFSALKTLYDLAQNQPGLLDSLRKGFLAEFLYLFRGINGELFTADKVDILETKGRLAGKARSKILDKYSKLLADNFARMKSGLDQDIIDKRLKLKHKILNYFDANEGDWSNYKWQLKYVIKDLKTLQSLVHLDEDEISGLELAKKYRIPFHITPYYLALFNERGRNKFDEGIRAQVIPSVTYCENVKQNQLEKCDMDFMGEQSTSPIDAVTRRYPQIVILKPLDTCPQICVYCQRNWEIKDIDEAKITTEKVNAAIDWIRNNKYVTEVLITGGDPLTLNNKILLQIIQSVAEIDHVERIRIGTRTLVTLPCRWDQELIDRLAKYNQLGKREVCIITHFEYPPEITPEVLTVINRIRKAGISIYNQLVYTYYNSKRYELCYMRRLMKLSGIDPYYTFNTKGKEETIDFRIPIARIQQERKEEARMLPGLVRTDEPVFNVPKLGKSHLRAWQDHEPVMITPGGERIYRFYPWESRIAIVDDYLYTDVSIYDYLKRLHEDGEDISVYKSIWYYF